MTLFHAWSVNGYVHRIHHGKHFENIPKSFINIDFDSGDWFGGKGVGLCKILVNNHPVNVYIAHVSSFIPDSISNK